MKNIPKKIFLQIGDEKLSSKDDFKDLEVTWCTDKIWDFDIEYILKSKEKRRLTFKTLEQIRLEGFIEGMEYIEKLWIEGRLSLEAISKEIERDKEILKSLK